VKGRLIRLMVVLGMAVFVVTGCSSAAPSPAPTKAPEAKAAEPTKAAAAPAAPTTAPAAPTAAPVQPTAVPVNFPEKGKNITFVIPFAAGGGSDLIVRNIAPLMEKDLGVPIVIVNKPGAATQTGTTDVVKSKADGYTIGIATLISTAVTYMDPDKQATYGRKDIQAISNLTVEDMVLTVNADSPYKTIKDILDAAKAKPGQVKIGTTGLMGIGHLAGLQLQEEAKVQFGYVHFDGAGPAMTALLGGHVDVTSTGVSTVLGQVKSGTLRVLGYLDNQQSKFFPQIKPITDQGYTVAVPAAYGVIGPAGIPKGVLDVLSKEFKATVENGDIVKKFEELGFTPRYMDPTQYSTYWDQRETQAKPLIDLAKKQE
jgi:tripartite-type tricarboxylate transporter receptor subunit TctC